MYIYVLWLLILFLFFIGLSFVVCFYVCLFFWHAGFISLWLGLGLIFRWSEIQISYLEVVNNFLSVGMQLELAVIKVLFIILYI